MVVVLGVGICFDFFVLEFASSVWLGFVVGVCHVMFDGLLFLKRWHCGIGACGVFYVAFGSLVFFFCILGL